MIDLDKSMRAKLRSWVAQLVIVAAIFTLLGFATAVAVFWNAPRVWSGSVVAGLAAGVGGVLGWALICGSRSRPAWWRTILAGMIAGVVLHPIYLLLESCLAGEPMALSDLITGSLFYLLVAGIITVPAGVAAAIACRGVSGWLSNQSSAEPMP